MSTATNGNTQQARLSAGTLVYRGGTNNAWTQKLGPSGQKFLDSQGVSLPTKTSTPATTKPPATQGPGGGGVVFDPMIAAAQRRLDEQLSMLQGHTAAQQNELQMQQQNAQQQLDRSHQQGQQYLQNRMASQGLLRSGINLGESNRMGEQFQTQSGELNSSIARALQQLQMQQEQGIMGIEGQREMLQLEQARLDQQAQLKAAEEEARMKAQQKQNEILQKLIQATQPHVTADGRLQVQGNHPNDAKYLKDINSAMERVKAIFDNRGVPVSYGAKGETEQQRLKRIAQELISGKRDFASVRRSVQILGDKQAESLYRKHGLMFS